MPKYAEIKNGIVRAMADSSVAPDHGGNLVVVDITEQPEIEEGWLYNGGTDFSAPTDEPEGPKEFRTLLNTNEFIGQFTFDEWSDIKGTTDPFVQKFIAALESYPKRLDTGHAKVTAAMLKIVQAGDININQTRAQEIVKGILR